ncbi:hypothetical protein [Peptostreptococcus canis]|uniref:Lipoprotein n=1 Tax=Peptostreptococcus canis TaxID=1159213 RepID=A0ABR6TMB0_9FIRM|nr:hypothetical protein [Peptostreptococcus canis]MBC2576562.1 hypothetical protein [Peptostreptococcus canis]MBP1998749.1 hypothetical protein [Peptostreptococcus canis]
MKKLILLLLTCILLVACNNKGRVAEKKYYPSQIKKLEYIENGEIKHTTEMYNEEYTILVDKAGNKSRIIVNKETYDKLSVGDEY